RRRHTSFSRDWSSGRVLFRSQNPARPCTLPGRRARRRSGALHPAPPQGSTRPDRCATFEVMRGFAGFVLVLLATSAYADDDAPEIGRASCRERAENSLPAVYV